MEWENAFGRRWSWSLWNIECQIHLFFNIRLFQERLWDPYSHRFFISFWWFTKNIFNDIFWNPYLSYSFLLRYLFWLYAPMSIRGDMVIFFFRWILELLLFIVLNIQVTSKRLGFCGRRRMILLVYMGGWMKSIQGYASMLILKKDGRWRDVRTQDGWWIRRVRRGKVKGHKDPRYKEDTKHLVLVEEVQGWTWKMRMDNQ